MESRSDIEQVMNSRQEFHKRNQYLNESVDGFVKGLVLIAAKCRFPSEWFSEAIRTQFINGLYDKTLRRYLIHQSKPFETLLGIAREYEISMHQQAANMERLIQIHRNAILNIAEHINVSRIVKTYIRINGVNVSFVIDTDSMITMLQEDWIPRLLQGYESTIYARGNCRFVNLKGTTIKLVGKLSVKIQTNEGIKLLTLYVTESRVDNILGFDWIRQLSIRLFRFLISDPMNELS